MVCIKKYYSEYNIEFNDLNTEILITKLENDNKLKKFVNNLINVYNKTTIIYYLKYILNYLYINKSYIINKKLLYIIYDTLFKYEEYDIIEENIRDYKKYIDINIFNNFIKKDNDIRIFDYLYNIYINELDFYQNNGKWLQVLLIYNKNCLPEIKDILKEYYIDKNIAIYNIILCIILYTNNKKELIKFLKDNNIYSFTVIIDKNTILELSKYNL